MSRLAAVFHHTTFTSFILVELQANRTLNLRVVPLFAQQPRVHFDCGSRSQSAFGSYGETCSKAQKRLRSLQTLLPWNFRCRPRTSNGDR